MQNFKMDAEVVKILAEKLYDSYNGIEIVSIFNKIEETLIEPRDVTPTGYCAISKRKFLTKYIEVYSDNFEFHNILLTILDPKKFITKKDLYDNIIKECNEILLFQQYKLCLKEDRTNLSIMPIEEKDDLSVYHISSGKKIKQNILDHISNAKVLIWIQMAWISDEAILKALKKKEIEGLNVQIITTYDEKNYSALKSYNFKQIYYYKKYKSTMHTKTYLFDLNISISGSQNATFSGENLNKEVMTTIINRQKTLELAEYFNTIKLEIEQSAS